jgi:hypothetical protein
MDQSFMGALGSSFPESNHHHIFVGDASRCICVVASAVECIRD